MKTLKLLLLLFPFIGISQSNPAIIEANIDDVYTQFGLSGTDVVFANIERGIDYTHPAYLNPDGTTRLAYLYDMIDPTGANDPDNPYGIGTIHTEAEINANLLSGASPPLSTDRYGHGTACTGIAVGNGGGTVSGEFQGVAPNAKIIAVKLIHDAFPPFASEPGQAGFFNPAYVPVALDFVRDKIVELGLPSVTLMNFGSAGGSTDGTSSITRAMDDFIAAGNILVCGVGDDGGDDNHAAGTILPGETQEVLINKAAGNLRFDMWYSEDDRFDITIEIPGGTQFGPFPSPAGPSSAVDQFNASFNMYHRGADVEFSGATSNKRELLIDFIGANGVYKVIINGAAINDNGQFNASLNPAAYFNNNRFLSHVVPGYSIADYASSFDVITPTNYVVTNNWTDINGIPRSVNGQGNVGEIWLGSSAGPTYDGRQGVDFASPGNVIFSPYSPNTYYSNFAFNMIQNGNGLYGVQSAVSAAAPLVCGVIALMLELDPTLTNAEVKNIIGMTSVSDAETGTVPNPVWGSGKMDALAAIQEVNNLLSLSEISTENTILYPIPVRDYLNIKSKNQWSEAAIFDLNGRSLISNKGQVSRMNLSTLSSGIYLLKLSSNKGLKTFKILKR